MEKAAVQVEGLTKKFGNTTAVNNITFQVNKGEFFVIVGPSGCGKTTTLRCISGLEKPDAGKIYINGVNVVDLPPHRRGLSMVFQNFAIFPHKTVGENIAFGLRMKGYKRDQIKSEVVEIARILGIEDILNRRPDELSVGQLQRVALARSLVIKPDILLFDEPLGNLHYRLQQKVMMELKELHRKLGLTFIYVTHSQEQAMTLATKIMVMNLGVIEQIGPPTEIYENPASVFVAKFIGEINMLRGDVVGVKGEYAKVKTDIGEFEGTLRGRELKGKHIAYAVRPEKMFIGEEAKECSNHVEAEFIGELHRGSDILYLVQLKDGSEFKVVKKGGEAPNLRIQPGERILIGWHSEDALLLDKPSVISGIDIDRIILGE